MKLSEILKASEKKHGHAYVFNASSFNAVTERIPSGIFELDLALGGGIPRGRVTTLYGQESSGKTTLALLWLAMEQRLNPKVKGVLIDIEHSFDPAWTAMLGVDLDRLAICVPPTAENAIDMCIAILEAEDASMIIVDSLAAMTTDNEAEKSADVMAVGSNSLIIGKFVRKVNHKLIEMTSQGHYPAILFINQMRYKVGNVHGDPEKQPGGQAPKHVSALTLRMGGMPIVDKAISSNLPARRKITFSTKKYKVPIHQTHFSFEMNLLPQNGMSVGQVDSWPTLQKYMKEFGMLVKGEKAGQWFFLGEEYPTLKVVRELLDGDVQLRTKCEQEVITMAVQQDWKISPDD